MVLVEVAVVEVARMASTVGNQHPHPDGADVSEDSPAARPAAGISLVGLQSQSEEDPPVDA